MTCKRKAKQKRKSVGFGVHTGDALYWTTPNEEGKLAMPFAN
ncbi:uncharacterized protein G2W53_025201 [Senna tora]|uniref:Uncharacterized protein n=1 Tax=Senna tora TaxID=362788 RepID=A0A834TEG1_9FABA|nr:uncharacterized protein G2W53_025201 [Senna tora]